MATKRESGRTEPADDVFTLSDLEQLRVVADPLRVRILEALCQERTTKQVAEQLGEKPTKLYHHVDALERVGLIRLTRTRPNRGTLEKYYQAVARTFRADTRLFPQGGSEETRGPLRSVLATILSRVGDELQELTCGADFVQELDELGAVTFVEIRADTSAIRQLRQKVDALVEGLAELDEPDGTSDASQRRFRLMVALYPLDSPASGDGDE